MSTSTSKYKSTPTFTFRGFNKTITSSNDPAALPSPLHYNPEKVSLHKSPTAKFPLSTRKQWAQIKYRQSLPGPGAYESLSYTTEGLKKTISKLTFKKYQSNTPSPNKYNINSFVGKVKQPSFTMQKRTISAHDLIAQKNIKKPSPGQYEQPIIKFKSTGSIIMPKAIRRISEPINQKNPGPGSYEAQKSFHSTVLSQSKCKIGKQKRKIDFSFGQRSPGPGNYEEKNNFVEMNKSKSRGYTLRRKFEEQVPQVPGPGRYQTPIIKKFKSAPIIKMVKSLRTSFVDKSSSAFKNNPGPGSFDLQGVDRVKFRSMSIHKFSKSKSNYLSDSINAQSSKQLGPGFYKPNDTIGKLNAPKFSFGNEKNRDIYSRSLISQKLPGPGEYDPKISLVHESQITHKLQKSQRTNFIKHLQHIPGPGKYQMPNNPEGLKFKFPKQKRANMLQSKLSNQKQQLHETYQERQQFPNPPKYMSVSPKIKYNEKANKN